MKPKVRCHYWGESRPIVNLGDLLVPRLLDALGFAAVPRAAADAEVVNPGRCLLAIGSLLTERDIARIGTPVDVWGCGWKGAGSEPAAGRDIRYFAVRGPHSAARLGLGADVALGDPALLVPQLLKVSAARHGRALVIPHFSRLAAMHATQRKQATGCDDLLSPLVLRRPLPHALATLSPKTTAALAYRRLRFGIPTCDLDTALARIAGARFVLTGSLHGAILAQAFGVPWACYDDGYLDAPAKWSDWGAYLGIDIDAVATRAEGERWWARCGSRGQVRDLASLRLAFPYPALPSSPQHDR